jgi:hypothetical protein
MPANHHAPASDEPPQGDSDQGNPDYDIILTALMESARGRAFLEEHARRSRVTETATLLTAIQRIEALLVSRSLEPAGQTEATPSAMQCLSPPQAELLDVDVFEAEPPQNENCAPQTEIRERIEAPDASELDIKSFQAAAEHVSAIEFLGPESVSAAKRAEPQLLSEHQAEAAQRQQRDPFADIRALSDEEKIALFA